MVGGLAPLVRFRSREFQPEIQTVGGFDAGPFRCDPDRRPVWPTISSHSAAANRLEVDLAFRLLLARLRRNHEILNVHVLRIRDDGSVLETINVKLHQYYKRLGFRFRSFNRPTFFKVPNRGGLDVFITIQLFDEAGENLVFSAKAF